MVTRETGLTSWNLPHSPFPDPKARAGGAHLDGDTAVEDEENHVHLPAILASLRATRGQIDHAGPEEGQGERFRKAEGLPGYFAHLDRLRGVGDF